MHLLKQTANDAVVNAVEDVISTASGTTFYLLSSVTDAPSSTFLTQNEGEPHPPPLCLPQSATPTTSVYLSQPHPPPLYTSVSHTHHLCIPQSATPTTSLYLSQPHPPPVYTSVSHTHHLCIPQSATPTTCVYLSQPHPPPLYTSVSHTHHHIYKCTLHQSRPNIHRIKSPSTPHKPDSGGLPKVSCFTNMYVRTHVGVVISTQYEMLWM